MICSEITGSQTRQYPQYDIPPEKTIEVNTHKIPEFQNHFSRLLISEHAKPTSFNENSDVA